MGKINHFLVRETELMRLNGQERTADAYVTTVRELMAFAGREVTFEQLTPEFLKAYEEGDEYHFILYADAPRHL